MRPSPPFYFNFNSIPETVTQTILYIPFRTDYRDYSDYPRIKVYHNSCCHFVVAQKILFLCYAVFVALAPNLHSVKYRFEALA